MRPRSTPEPAPTSAVHHALGRTRPPAVEALAIVSNGGGDEASITCPSGGTGPVTQVLAVSPEPGPVAYTIQASENAAAFTLDAATGELRFQMVGGAFPPAADSVYKVTVQAAQGAETDTRNLSIELIQGLAVVAKRAVVMRNGESADLDVRVLDAHADSQPVPFTVTAGSPGVATFEGGVATAVGQPSAHSTFTVTSDHHASWAGFVAVRNLIDITPDYEQTHYISSSDDYTAFGSNAGTPSTSYYADIFRVTLPAGPVTVIMDSGNVLDTYLLLIGPDGYIVAANDDDGEGELGLGSRIVYTVTQPGVYLIEASTFSGLDIGNYTMKVQLAP